MHLTPREQERLLLAAAADLARRRLARGAPIGATEAVALVCDEICELAWDGVALDTVIERARSVIPAAALLPGVASLVPVLEVEALFPWGTTLVHVDRPFPEDQSQRPPYLERTEETLARSQSPTPGAFPDAGDATDEEDSDGARGRPGQVRAAAGDIDLAPGAPRREVVLHNTGQRDVWISSHFPLNQVNPAVQIRFAEDSTDSVRHADIEAATAGHENAMARPLTASRLDLPAGEALLVQAGGWRTATAVVMTTEGEPLRDLRKNDKSTQNGP
jgi:urease subunit gamma/beta